MDITITDEMRTAARQLQELIINFLKETNGSVHSETAVATAAGVAGALMLIQYHGDQIKTRKLNPGDAILSQEVNVDGPKLLQILFTCEKQAGIKTDRSKEIPADNQPHLDHKQINITIVPQALAVCDKNNLKPEQRPLAAILATALVIEQVQSVLEPAIANAIACQFVVFCSKTVPAII